MSKFLTQNPRSFALYAAGGMLVFACLICALPAAADAAADDATDFVPLFNGRDLTGWEGDAKLWIVEREMLVGRSAGIKHNNFLATTKTYRDFVLRFQVRLLAGKGNSGVQFRSQRVPPPSHEVSGYQADIAEGWWGKLYDESRRNRVLAGPPQDVLDKTLKPADWNDYEIQAVGNHIILRLNGVTTVDYTEADADIAREGIIATQIHSGGPMEVQFRNIRIKELPAP
jgi:hypothetical protein